MTKQSASKSGFPIGCLALLLLSALSASCIAPKPAGTSEQATSAQTVMATGRANISQRISELSAVINRVRPLASTQLLVTEPVMLPLTPVLESQINADFGIHKETTPGVFTLTPGGGSISVELLNGIDFGISNIDTNTTSGEIMSFQLNVTSNNRSIVTPVEQAAEIHITYQRFQIPILLANATPAGIIISGSVEFTRTGETTALKYAYDRVLGTGNAATGLDISSGIQSYIKDITNGPTNAPFWNDSEFVIYTKTDVPGLWVGYNITKNYRDLNVNYNISMSLQSSTSNIATTGTATYGGRGTVLYNNSVIVANVSGGPWDCNVNIPTDTGSGTPIILTWVDSVVDTLLPNQDHTCARAILNETTTP